MGHVILLMRKDIYSYWPRLMTEISINEMIVKANSLPFYDKFVEAVRSMLLTFQDMLSSPK